MKREKQKKANAAKLRLFIIYPVLTVIFAVSLFFTAFFESIFNLAQTVSYGAELSNNALKVYYADVGQGDLSLIITPENKTILIDVSTKNERKKAEQFLTETLINKGITEIDYVIVTHPDEDHIGNFPWVFANFQVYNIYLPKISYEKNGEKLSIVPSNFNNFPQKAATVSFKEFLTAVFTEPNCNKFVYEKDEYLDLDVEFKFISEHREAESSINNFSPVIKLSYMGRKFVWTGDANTVIENRILNNVDAKAEIVDVDVYKAGHHGSNSSSSKNFLEAMLPSMIVVSCGENNTYGHPGAEFRKRAELLSSQPEVITTYENGDILVYVNSDGSVGFVLASVNTSSLRWYMIAITAEFFLILLCINDTLYLIRKR